MKRFSLELSKEGIKRRISARSPTLVAGFWGWTRILPLWGWRWDRASVRTVMIILGMGATLLGRIRSSVRIGRWRTVSRTRWRCHGTAKIVGTATRLVMSLVAEAVGTAARLVMSLRTAETIRTANGIAVPMGTMISLGT